MRNKLLTIFFAIAVAVLVLTFSISLPIYLRFFYYLQIDGLSLPYYSGYSVEQIKTSYDAMLNYLTLPGGVFSSGEIPHTASFASHMADVKGLFTLNLVALILSCSSIVALLILDKKGRISLCRPFGMHVAFTSCASLLSLFLLIGGLCALDFNGAFAIFHQIFFAGKDNWQFSPMADPVLRILPMQFFLNCALLILASIVLVSLAVIVFQTIKKIKTRS